MDTLIFNVSTRDSRKCLFKWTEQHDKENKVEQSVTPLVSLLEKYYACLDVTACIISISITELYVNCYTCACHYIISLLFLFVCIMSTLHSLYVVVK